MTAPPATPPPTDAVGGYADAAVAVARAEGVLEAVSEELFRFRHALAGSEDLRRRLADADIPPERRQAALEEVLGSRAHPLTVAFLSFVVASGRARSLPAILDRVVEASAAAADKEVAEVRSATELDADQQRRLAEALGANLGRPVDVKVVVDPSVMGGLVARVGDTVIDGTVRHRLDQLREAL